LGLIKNIWSRNGVTWSREELLQNEKELTTKLGNNLSLSSCAVPQSAVADGDQKEFDHKTKVITNESKIISKMFHNCVLNK